jgi:hypothetical protein
MMRLPCVPIRAACLAAATLWSPGVLLAEPPSTPDALQTVAQADPAAMREYRRKLEEYTRAREAYEAEATTYWTAITEKRKLRIAKRRGQQEVVLDDYVLTQPPVYSGPRRPVDPSGEPSEEPTPRAYVPVVADFLKAAADEFSFVPQRPKSELEYKQAYARVAAAAGISREQAVRVYSFEAGGNGKHDVQAGLELARPGARAITTALGYNQLLTTNTVSIMAENGDRLVKALKVRAAAASGDAQGRLERKIAVLQRMIDFARSVPNAWSEHEKIANTPKGLGAHAMNLDIDVGPLLQTQKLLDSVVFARRKGFAASLSAAELEMMNLTGDGNGFDMVTMPGAWRSQVPTSNFFQRGGYQRNPVASRNNVVAKLIAATDAKMDRDAKLAGAQELAAAFSPLVSDGLQVNR